MIYSLTKRLARAMLPDPVWRRQVARRQYKRLAVAFPAREPVPHALDGELVVSLTSYPPRFPTLDLTIKSLLRQDVRPDRIVLWIAHDDIGQLPNAVLVLKKQGLDIRAVADVRSYKKLVFALEQFPGAFIVTADDDVFYKPGWLRELTQGATGPDASGNGAVIACHRAHRMREDAHGALLPYLDWEWDVQDDRASAPSGDLMPTGVGGILYPPGSLHADATDARLYRDYAPQADDLWFFWSARRAGSTYRKVGPEFERLTWEASQDVRLYDSNIDDNDGPIGVLLTIYGNPMHMGPTGRADGTAPNLS